MSWRVVYQWKNDNVLVELPHDTFRELLIEYLDKWKDPTRALHEIEEDLKKQTKYV